MGCDLGCFYVKGVLRGLFVGCSVTLRSMVFTGVSIRLTETGLFHDVVSCPGSTVVPGLLI